MATDGGIYVLDEPTSGLHLADVEQLLGLLDRLGRLRQDGHRDRAPPGGDGTRRLDHRPRPRAGHDGGQVVFEGTPVEIVAERSTLTGQHLAAYVRVSRHPALTDPPRPTNS
jgi:excinuclease UvrABC ATPase subunit